MGKDVQAAVLKILKQLRGTEPLKQLFWSELSYDRVNQPISRRGWPESASNRLAEDPNLFAGHGDFHVIYLRLADRLSLGLERQLANKLLHDHPYSLFVISDHTQTQWHFINVKYSEDAAKRRLFRRITIGPGERLRTASERISMLDLVSIGPSPAALSPLTIQDRHDQAFDVEAVTNAFFEEYKSVFTLLQDDLYKQTRDRAWAHDYALQFLNRVMFLYFVQRKRWLGGDSEFLKSFWETYKQSKRTNDTFFDQWLTVLFFEAFNNQFQAGCSDYRHFPENLKHALAMAPYLNGGLFLRNPLDGQHTFKITDSRFDQVFRFLERYNFTITEDSPLDQEVAVDPEMVGKVYESLVNVSEQVDERGEAGIFYTPRTEIALMCRLSLVDHLANHLGSERKQLLYNAVFAIEEEEKQQADEALTRANLWPSLDQLLREITVLDPAVGSGSFLVGMLTLISDLSRRANKQVGHQETDYELKKRIIGQSLYGVDVMQWAVDVCELRLWLQLVIDTELEPAELKFRPLLPNLSFKIRRGDSLVQEVGGVNLSYIKAAHDISTSLKGRLTQLKGEKLKFYNNDPERKYRSEEGIFQEELQIFRDILDARYHNLTNEIKTLKKKIEGPQEAQIRLDGTIEPQTHQLKLQAVEWQRQLEEIQSGIQSVEDARRALRTAKDIPLVWDVSFVEIFEGDKEGFDIVIGNPPYVRQEKIADPKYIGDDRDLPEKKKTYKAKLARSVYMAHPRFFGYKASTDKAAHKLDAKSDLYIYFYFHGLSLLNEKGSFCFITSNSWLDIGYGADLQEFLLKHCHVKMIIDNQVRRSFSQADVNTIIALFSAPEEKTEWGLDRITRFVMLKVPFEYILSPIIFEEIEEASKHKTLPEYRVFPVGQKMLLEEGFEVSDEEEVKASKPSRNKLQVSGPLIKLTKYIGNKWGGKYLRAPDIYFTILAKGKPLIKSLSHYFDGERYLNTGGADGFFVLKQVSKIANGRCHIFNEHVTRQGLPPFDGNIEEEYLVPLIKDYTKVDKRIEIHGYDAYCLVITGTPSARVKKYIEWGEMQEYHKRSVTKNQRPWFKPTNQMTSAAKILVPRSFNDTFVVHYNPKSYLSLRFYRLHTKQGKDVQLVGFLNSTLVALILESLGNKNLGQGVLDFFMEDFLALRIPVVIGEDIETAFRHIKNRAVRDVKTEFGVLGSPRGSVHVHPLTDRKQLDDVVFDALRLTQGERDAIYEAVINLVEVRLKKAGSLKVDLKTVHKHLKAAEDIRGIWADIPDVEESDEGAEV
jgi:Eco57I restriction-modification methylase/Type II methyltransferase M.Eco57I, C-terminal domain